MPVNNYLSLYFAGILEHIFAALSYCAYKQSPRGLMWSIHMLYLTQIHFLLPIACRCNLECFILYRLDQPFSTFLLVTHF
jgi:hypothetical protein